ncbi:hypothetical protein FB446DRAFT_718850 [Lentinula raphanica]|nr:hypothetical protein FB446DRAFT_718850 [Lentinula raphanica]
MCEATIMLFAVALQLQLQVQTFKLYSHWALHNNEGGVLSSGVNVLTVGPGCSPVGPHPWMEPCNSLPSFLPSER